MPVAKSTPNIALIKYWGNRNDALRLPAADSLSMTINTPSVDVTIEESDTFAVESFNPDGSERTLSEEQIERFRKQWELANQFIQLNDRGLSIVNCQLSIVSGIPPGIGLASSAAVFSALARAYQGLLRERCALTDAQVSVLARLGSGSAARSIFGGFVALEAGEGNAIDSSKAVQIAQADHWTLHDIIIAPSREEKKVGSTEGHKSAHTSPHFASRIEAIANRRQKECTDSILQRDFEKLQRVSEEDCMDMHNVMQTQDPPLNYLSSETHRIIDEIKDLRESEHLEVLFTMDAGPTVHLFCTDSARARIAEFAHKQEGCKVFEANIGEGAHLI